MQLRGALCKKKKGGEAVQFLADVTPFHFFFFRFSYKFMPSGSHRRPRLIEVSSFSFYPTNSTLEGGGEGPGFENISAAPFSAARILFFSIQCYLALHYEDGGTWASPNEH